jgi:hypothetical protein
MRTRKRNWILKRIVLGFAVLALVVPGAAKARVDEGSSQAKAYVPFVTDFPRYESTVKVSAGDYGMPRAMPSDYSLQRGDSIEVARTHERIAARDGDLIENVRLEPRSVSTPQLVSSPGFDWSDAGIGASLLLGLMLVGGAAFYGTRHLGKAQTA